MRTELLAVQRSTGIPNVVAGIPLPRAAAAVRGLELRLSDIRVGAFTPAQAFGAGFALRVPGTTIKEL